MVKSVLKKLVNATGYKISRNNTQQRFIPYIKDVKLAGTDFRFWINSESAEYWYTEQNFLLEVEHLTKLIAPGDKILDVGCNIGVLSTVMSRLSGANGRVVALDVLPDNCLTACAQLGLNKITNCEVINVGASDIEQEIVIADTSNSNVVHSDKIEEKILKVKALPIDNFKNKYGSFNLLKIDVEGFEVSVFKGAKELLKSRPKIALELHGGHLKQYNTSVEELFDLMQINTYEGFILHKYTNKFEMFDAAKAIKEPPLANLFLTPKM